MAVPDKDTRDARLDDLAEKTQKWAEKKRKRLRGQVTFGRNLLRGRTGSERLANNTFLRASDLLVEEIDDFLTGV